MKPRTFLPFALVALLGVAAAAPALATSKVKLEVNQNCVDPNWPCWTTEGSASRPQPTLKVTVTEGGEVEFADHDASTTASVVWTGGPATPSCPGVPTTTTASTGWEGTCTFTTSGTYHFESSTLWNNPPYEDYTKYEVEVTGPPTPTANTEQATGVTETEATLNGSVNPEAQATSYYFDYGTSTAYGKKTTELPVGNDSNNHVEHQLTAGLTPGTTYHFRIVATYGSGKKTFGNDQTFTTASPPGRPTASTRPATEMSETNATLNGEVNPNRGTNAEYFFEWGVGASGAYEHTTMPSGTLPADAAEHSVFAKVEGLSASTEYHYRVVAINSVGGPVDGENMTFKTSSPPAKETTPSPNPSTTVITSTLPKPEEKLATLGPAIAAGSLKLSAPRHSSSVRGSLEVSKSGAGGRLEIDLIAKSASLAKVRHKKAMSTVVGRLVRTSVSAGKVSFSVSLNARAKSALRRHHKLALTVKITLTPRTGASKVLARSIVLRA